MFIDKPSQSVSELPEKDISNVVVQDSKNSRTSCRGLCLNYLKKISQTWWSRVARILEQAVVACV